MGRQLWLVDALRRWHLSVVEIDGWTSRGDDSFDPRGGVAHHTAGPSGGGDIPSLNTLIYGRPDLDGPLCNIGLGRSGTCYVIAAGRANHAGKGGWRGLEGNSSVVGIEAENDGYQPWPPEQTDAYVRASAALAESRWDAGMWCRHHEWRSEKPDPHDVDGDTARANIAAVLTLGPDYGTDHESEEDEMGSQADRLLFDPYVPGQVWLYSRGWLFPVNSSDAMVAFQQAGIAGPSAVAPVVFDVYQKANEAVAQ